MKAIIIQYAGIKKIATIKNDIIIYALLLSTIDDKHSLSMIKSGKILLHT